MDGDRKREGDMDGDRPGDRETDRGQGNRGTRGTSLVPGPPPVFVLRFVHSIAGNHANMCLLELLSYTTVICQ